MFQSEMRQGDLRVFVPAMDHVRNNSAVPAQLGDDDSDDMDDKEPDEIPEKELMNFL